MNKKLLLLFFTIALFFNLRSTIFAQVFEEYTVDALSQTAPLKPKLKDFKTFDVRLIKYTALNAPIEIKNFPDSDFSTLLSSVSFNPLKQVTDGGDLHVVVLLQAYSDMKLGAYTGFYITLYDKFMNVQGTFQKNWSYLEPKASKKLTDDSAYKVKFKANLESALEDFLATMYKAGVEGHEKYVRVTLAQFSKAKNWPDLKDFNVIIEETNKTLRKQGTNAWLKEITKDDIKYWGEFVNEKDDTDQNDIKRAALHNLCVYYTLNHDEKMARDYLEKYKKVDVELKFNGVKFRYSDRIEEVLINEIFPKKETEPLLTQEIPLDAILEKHQFITVEGTAIPYEGDKFFKEPFKGTIKIVKPEPYFNITNSGAVSTLGGKDVGVPIKLFNGKELVKQLYASNIQKITSNDDSKEFVVRKFRLLTFTYFTLLERTYKGPKVALYEQLFVEDSPVSQKSSNPERQNIAPEVYFWLAKTGDTEGVQTTFINVKKRVFEYFSDCPSIKEKYSEVSYNKLNMKDIVADYDKCK